MYLDPITEDELYQLINKQDVNKASGYDNISMKVVKYVLDVIHWFVK